MPEGSHVPAPGERKGRAMNGRRRYLSLFTGAGGLDLGLEAAGFSTALCVELDESSRKTLAANRSHWKLAEPGDIHAITPREIMRQGRIRRRQLDLLAGGPPCQPFSKSGYWAIGDSRRLADPRASTLDAYLGVVEAALPTVVLLENVRGITFEGKDEGLQLLRKKLGEINEASGTKYDPVVIHINAVDYGVPQIRERVFVVAHRGGKSLELPPATHAMRNGSSLPAGILPCTTAWDAIGDLDEDTWPSELDPRGKWGGLLPSIPEGENYLWHTPRSGGKPLFGWRTRYWSFLLKLTKDRPSWTIQAQPGPATGPFHWKGRQLSRRELARLQTFPDDYEIHGEDYAAKRQLGNAVPPALGELWGLEIRRQFFGERVRRTLRLVPESRDGCPGPEKPKRVPKRYLDLLDDHADHPGHGKGPGARRRVREAQS